MNKKLFLGSMLLGVALVAALAVRSRHSLPQEARLTGTA